MWTNDKKLALFKKWKNYILCIHTLDIIFKLKTIEKGINNDEGGKGGCNHWITELKNEICLWCQRTEDFHSSWLSATTTDCQLLFEDGLKEKDKCRRYTWWKWHRWYKLWNRGGKSSGAQLQGSRFCKLTSLKFEEMLAAIKYDAFPGNMFELLFPKVILLWMISP